MLRPGTAAKRVLLGIELREVGVDTRGFSVDDAAVQSRIETIGRAFVHGYETALGSDDLEQVVAGMNLVHEELAGFAFEGAAMGLTVLDELRVGAGLRWPELRSGVGDRHVYMLHVGAGWAFARLPGGLRRLARFLNRCDPLLGCLAVDGYGFHQGFFGLKGALDGVQPRFAVPYLARAFDQGLGRSLWFVEGANVDRVATTVHTFAAHRHSDLWSGVGLACAYAGMARPQSLERLRVVAGAYLPHLQQGVAFAATARLRAGNVAPHTDEASRLLCGRSVAELAGVTDARLALLGPDPAQAQYEAWRVGIASALSDVGSRS